MSDNDPKIRLFHMRDYAQKIISLSNGKEKANLDEDEIFCLAMTRLIELIGEAASKYPKEKQSEYPQIPWPKIISMRNRLIHGYDFVDYDILWDAITINMPQLLAELEKILSPET
ncbi:MAG: DUF86 domain-containing protein [Proteobacteria bacterium]|nr:DUF86 domain-containing protein [Pseudomonadota bacterium]